MQTAPLRVAPKRSLPLLHRGTDADWAQAFRPGVHWIGRVRALRRSALLLVWSLLAAPVQAVFLAVPGPARVGFARTYWSVFCSLFGLQVRCIGTEATRDGRPVVFVSNHSSWLDVVVLGARLHACFVSKQDVAGWPGVNLVAKLGRTVFVSRLRTGTGRESNDMRRRLAEGDNLILFPEGTTSDGSRVLPFRSAFLSIAEGEPCPLVQPVSVVYDRLAGLPTGRATRPVFAYYGGMDIGRHFWRLAQCHGLRATVVLHEPLDPRDYADRKALTLAAWHAVASGAATLRQNRPAQPVPAQARVSAAEMSYATSGNDA